MKDAIETVDEYIQCFPKKTQTHLKAIRKVIKANAPDAEEQIAYKMPAFKLIKRPLVYFAAYEKHIGLYATPSGHAKFKKELSIYKQGKGSVQFPLDQPMPLDLIKRIVEFRVSESMEKVKSNK